MATYKVKSLYAFGLHKTFRSGDIVTDKDFYDGHAPQLVKEGFLEEMPEAAAEAAAEEPPAPPVTDPEKEQSPPATEPAKSTTPVVEQTTTPKPIKPGKKK